MTDPHPVPKGDVVTWAIRAELRRVDRALVELIAERLELVQRLWAHKRAAGVPLEDREQERLVVGRARRTARQSGLEPAFAEGILLAVIAEGKRRAWPPRGPPPRAHPPVAGRRSRRTA